MDAELDFLLIREPHLGTLLLLLLLLPLAAVKRLFDSRKRRRRRPGRRAPEFSRTNVACPRGGIEAGT